MRGQCLVNPRSIRLANPAYTLPELAQFGNIRFLGFFVTDKLNADLRADSIVINSVIVVGFCLVNGWLRAGNRVAIDNLAGIRRFSHGRFPGFLRHL